MALSWGAAREVCGPGVGPSDRMRGFRSNLEPVEGVPDHRRASFDRCATELRASRAIFAGFARDADLLAGLHQTADSSMARADISWVRTDSDGEKIQLYAHQVGTRWDFFSRPGRHDNWETLENPLLDDWLELLDGVRRRAQRRLYSPEEVRQLEVLVRKRFPRAKFE